MVARSGQSIWHLRPKCRGERLAWNAHFEATRPSSSGQNGRQSDKFWNSKGLPSSWVCWWRVARNLCAQERKAFWRRRPSYLTLATQLRYIPAKQGGSAPGLKAWQRHDCVRWRGPSNKADRLQCCSRLRCRVWREWDWDQGLYWPQTLECSRNPNSVILRHRVWKLEHRLLALLYDSRNSTF